MNRQDKLKNRVVTHPVCEEGMHRKVTDARWHAFPVKSVLALADKPDVTTGSFCCDRHLATACDNQKAFHRAAIFIAVVPIGVDKELSKCSG